MEPLFDALFTYALEHHCSAYLLRDAQELRKNDDTVHQAMGELTKAGFGDLANRTADGMETRSCLEQRALFRAGVSIGMELLRL